MYGNKGMGYERQTSKFKSAFGDLPPPSKSKKYAGNQRKPVSFFDSQKMDGYTVPANQEMDGEDDYQIDINNAESPPGQERASESEIVESDPSGMLQQQEPDVSVSPPQKAKKGSALEEQKGQTSNLAEPGDDREPKLFVDVNVANFGLQRIVVYDGDTVESLVADFVKRCPIDEFMVEKLKLLLQQQMDGVLERIEEDDDQEASDEDEMGVRGKKGSIKKDEEGRASTGRLQPEKVNSEPFNLSASSPKQQQPQPVYPVDLGTEEDDAQEESKGQTM